MPTPLMRRRASSGRPPLAETSALIGAMTAKPSLARQALIDQTIRSLKASGVWAKLDAIHFIAAHTSQAGYLNWKNPATITITESAAGGTFTADRGYLSDGTAYLNTNYNPTSVGGNFTQNSASYGAWSRTDAQSNLVQVGANPEAEVRLIFRRTTSTEDAMSARINDANNDQSTATIPASTGLLAAGRPNASTKRFYRNGAQVGADVARASTALFNDNILLGNNNGTISAYQFAMCFAGGSLTSVEHAALYAATLAYMQGVGEA